MSAPVPPVGLHALRPVLDHWMEALGQLFDSLTGRHAKPGWQEAKGPEGAVAGADGDETLWWEQPLRGADSSIWVGAPQETWRSCASLMLEAAGLDSSAAEEVRGTWLEILNQALAAFARSVSEAIGREVLCEAGAERAPASTIRDWISLAIEVEQQSFAPLLVGFSPDLALRLAAPAPAEAAEPTASRSTDRENAANTSRTMDLLLDLELPISISFGRAQLPLKDVLKLTTGSIVELNRTANDPVEILVNHRLVARGEVVVVDGNYGVRIQEIATRQDRLRSIP